MSAMIRNGRPGMKLKVGIFYFGTFGEYSSGTDTARCRLLDQRSVLGSDSGGSKGNELVVKVGVCRSNGGGADAELGASVVELVRGVESSGIIVGGDDETGDVVGQSEGGETAGG